MACVVERRRKNPAAEAAARKSDEADAAKPGAVPHFQIDAKPLILRQ